MVYSHKPVEKGECLKESSTNIEIENNRSFVAPKNTFEGITCSTDPACGSVYDELALL